MLEKKNHTIGSTIYQNPEKVGLGTERTTKTGNDQTPESFWNGPHDTDKHVNCQDILQSTDP